jgi:hypothetical protein
MHLLRSADHSPPAKVRSFIDFIVERFG